VLIAALAASAVGLLAPVAQADTSPPSLARATTTEQIFAGHASDPYTLAVRAYVWGYPLVNAAQVRLALTNPADPFATRPPTSAGAALNNMGFQSQLSGPTTPGVGVNDDTLYALAWLDLSQGPFVLKTPDFGSRYYTFQMAQADESTAYSYGQRTNGSHLPPLFISGPGYWGRVPRGMIGVHSTNRYFLIAGRILVNPNVSGDYQAVYALQQQIKLVPYRKYLLGLSGPNTPPAELPLISPTSTVPTSLRFLEELGTVMRNWVPNPTLGWRGMVDEIRLVQSLRPIGLTPQNGFDPSRLTAATHAEIAEGLADGSTIIHNSALNLGAAENGWRVDLQGPTFGNDWLLRAAVAVEEPYINLPQEALYPVASVDSSGNPLTGENAYDIHFAPGELPPVGAFWSVTLYNQAGSLVANSLNRYSVGSLTPGLVTNPDGSLDIHIQNTAPASGTTNWLPAPTGPFYLILRLYIPGTSVLSGTWEPPPIVEVPAS
jgi:hypothetical protein